MADAASVLVVDDDPTVSDVVRRYLERAGYLVRLAADGRGALASFANQRPDLVVLDLMLPGMDGLEVCRRLRADGDEVPSHSCSPQIVRVGTVTRRNSSGCARERRRHPVRDSRANRDDTARTSARATRSAVGSLPTATSRSTSSG